MGKKEILNGINRLMPRADGGFPYSRDYAMRIECENTKCYLHSAGTCSSPAVVAIDSTGRCVQYGKQKESNLEKILPEAKRSME